MTETKGEIKPAWVTHPISIRVGELDEQIRDAEKKGKRSASERLRELKERELHRLADEIEQTELEELLAKRKNNLKKLREGSSPEGNGEAEDETTAAAALKEEDPIVKQLTTPQAIKQLGELTDEQAERASQILGRVLALRQLGPQGGSMLPYILSQAAANPGMGEKQLGAYTDTLFNAFTKGMELMQTAKAAGSGGQGQGWDPSTIFDKARTLVQEIQQEKGEAPDPVTTTTKLITNLKEAGLVVPASELREGAKSASDSVMLQIEKMRMDHNRDMAEGDRNHEIKMAQLGLEKQRTDAIVGGLQRIPRAIGRSLMKEEGGGEEEPGGQAGRARAPAATSRQTLASSLPIGAMNCEGCGSQIVIPNPERYGTPQNPRVIKCPNLKCGREYDYMQKQQ